MFFFLLVYADRSSLTLSFYGCILTIINKQKKKYTISKHYDLIYWIFHSVTVSQGGPLSLAMVNILPVLSGIAMQKKNAVKVYWGLCVSI